MAQARLPEVNAQIRKEVDPSIELRKGKGFHYFVKQEANSFLTDFVPVAHTSQQPKEAWVEGAKTFARCASALAH